MKKLNLILAGLAIVALAACNKDLGGASVPAAASPEEGRPEVAFRLGGEFAPHMETRATEITDSNLGTLYVTATTGTSSETAVSGFTSVSFSKSGGVYKGGKYWPSTNPNYHFYAGNVALTHTSTGATVSPANAGTDVVVGYIATPDYEETNNLTLKHIFARFTDVTLKAPAGYTASAIKLSIQPKTSGTYNLKSDSWTTKGSAGSAVYLAGTASSGLSITSAGGSVSVNSNDLYLVPDSYTLTLTYTLAKGDWSKAYSKTASVTVLQGKKNKITLVGDAANIPDPDDGDISEVDFNVEVDPWTENELHPNF